MADNQRNDVTASLLFAFSFAEVGNWDLGEARATEKRLQLLGRHRDFEPAGGRHTVGSGRTAAWAGPRLGRWLSRPRTFRRSWSGLPVAGSAHPRGRQSQWQVFLPWASSHSSRCSIVTLQEIQRAKDRAIVADRGRLFLCWKLWQKLEKENPFVHTSRCQC